MLVINPALRVYVYERKYKNIAHRTVSKSSRWWFLLPPRDFEEAVLHAEWTDFEFSGKFMKAAISNFHTVDGKLSHG